MYRFLVVISCVVVFSGCSPYARRQVQTAEDLLAKSQFEGQVEFTQEDSWWCAFDDIHLHTVIGMGVSSSPQMAVAWSRLQQANSLARQAGAARYPSLELSASGSRSRDEGVQQVPGLASVERPVSYRSNFLSRSGLSFEVDLWRRLASTASAAELRSVASRADLQNSQLMYTGAISETWFQLKERAAALDLAKRQRGIAEEIVKLVELRYVNGMIGASDVLRQRERLNELQSDIPRIEAILTELQTQLSSLLGAIPSNRFESYLNASLPKLPAEVPNLRAIDLIETRPDLRAAKARFDASEFDVAAAIADRYPRLRLSLDYQFQTTQIEKLFEGERGTLANDVVLPLIDGGRRRAQVDLQMATSDQFLQEYKQTFIDALGDVSAELSSEVKGRKVLVHLNQELADLQKRAAIQRERYLNGSSTYQGLLEVRAQILVLKRRLLSEQLSLLVTRSRLYRALGGRWSLDSSTEGFCIDSTGGENDSL